LSREDAREIVANLGGFVRTLQEWEAAEKEGGEKQDVNGHDRV